MMNPPIRRSYEIIKAVKTDFQVILKSYHGSLRIKPQNEEIIRVTFTEREDFEDYIGIGILKENDFENWDFVECEDKFVVKTEKVALHINKKTGSIKYFKKNGNLILSEREYLSHELGEFDSMKTVVDENTVIEEIETPDGLKRVIKEASTVFDRNLYHTRLNLKFQDDEKIYGLGQAEEGSLNLRGTVQYVHQANLKIAIPLFISTKNYAILSSTGSPSIFCDNEYGTYFYTEADVEMDFYFIHGEDFDEIIKGYRFLTGKAVMLPRWAFGFLQSQEAYETQEEILEVARKHREKNIGLDLIIMDWSSWKPGFWGEKILDKERFPTPKEMTDKLHEIDVKFMISIWPNANETTKDYNEFFDENLLLPGNVIYNAYDQRARELYWKQANEGLFSYGVDAWWCDSSEPHTPEWGSGNMKNEPSHMFREFVEVSSKCAPNELTNAYGLVHSQTIYEGQRATTDRKRVMNLTRNSYTGGQRYGTVMWSGDTHASWDTYKKQIVAGLNFCVTGFPYWTLDIGAFFVKQAEQWFWNGEYNKGNEDLGYRELFTRWFQYAGFLPIFRSHGTDTRREMWLFDGENHMFYNALLKANKLRYILIPYIYSLAGRVWLEDYTMMRMLAFDFQNDEIAIEQKYEFMFGDSFLVCPVTKAIYYNANSVPVENPDKTQKVYLPKGSDWFDFYTNEKYSGGQTIEIELEIDKMPLFVKSGSIIPMTKPLESTAQLDNAEIEIHIYKGCDCEFTLYEDSGDSYDCEKGEYELTHFYWNESENSLNISKDDREFKIIYHD